MGFVWLDRHLHKNGGSTVRELMRMHEEAGGCVYWGYSLSAESWPRLLRLLRSLNSSEARPPSLCVEEHGSAASARFVTTHLPDLLRLREQYRQQHVPVPIILTTRVREPLSYYLSFYRWKILGMQLHGNRIAVSPGHEAVNPIGSSFLEWAPPNLQSVGLLHGDVELFAGLRQGGFPGVRAGRRRPHPYWVANHLFEARHFKALLGVLSSFDVVAPLEQFDAAARLTAELTGLPPLQLGEEDRVVSPRALGVPRGTNTSYAFICPDMAACRAHVRRIAPWDHKLYRRVARQFRARPRAVRPLPPSVGCSASRRSACCCAQGNVCLNMTGRERHWRTPAACLPGSDAIKEAVATAMRGVCCSKAV